MSLGGGLQCTVNSFFQAVLIIPRTFFYGIQLTINAVQTFFNGLFTLGANQPVPLFG